MNVEDELKNVLLEHMNVIRKEYNDQEVIFGLIEIIRTLDYKTFMLAHNINEGDLDLLEKYKMGWAPMFISLYADLILKDVPLYPSKLDDEKWAEYVISNGASIQMCNLFLDYTKADLMKLESNESKKFTFSYLIKYSYEYYEKRSIFHYHSIMEKILEEKIKLLTEKLPEVRNSLQNIVTAMYDNFISYKANDEHTEFYKKFGYLYMMTTQTVDEFDESDKFGSYTYKDFLDIAESIFSSGLMHRDCCMALAIKTSDKIYLRNILTYGFSIENYVDSLSAHLNWNKDKTKDIISCFSLNKDNYLHHLSYPKASIAPFIQLGRDIWFRSVHGCLDKPIFFLNRELKRKYSKDYYNAVNNREYRFKMQLYSLFEQDKIIKIKENIIINVNGTITDIDAVLFDKEKQTLGLFQLKWQDTFGSSMKERFSRISNLIPKSVEWIDKVENWIKSNDHKKILRTLNIDSDKINDIHIFIISRNHVHFTNHALDQRAIWASWYQVVEASSTVKSLNIGDPIREFANKLEVLSPNNRIKFEKVAVINGFTFKVGDYNISIEPE